jgi:hypothetical protein
VHHAFGGGSALTGVIGVVQMAILVLPALALVATFWLLLKRIHGRGLDAHRRETGRARRVPRRAGQRPGCTRLRLVAERRLPRDPAGREGDAAGRRQELGAVPTGRPSLTKQRAQQLGAKSDTTTTPTKQRPRTSTTDTTTPAENDHDHTHDHRSHDHANDHQRRDGVDPATTTSAATP